MPTTILDETGLNRLLEVSDAAEKTTWLLMADAGCRLREALSFNPSSLGSPGLHIWGSKVRRWRWCFITDRLGEALRRSNPLALSGRQVQRRLRARGEQIGLGSLKPHDLRHTFATRLAAAGVDIYPTIMRLMGHSRPTVTEIYVHLGGQLLDLAKAALEARIGLKRR